MVSETVLADTSWSNLAAVDDTARRAAMVARFQRLALADEPTRVRELESMVRAEYALPEAELHAFTLCRLRAWIGLHAEDPGQAQAIATAYDRVFERVPAGLAMRRASVVQTVARTDLEEAELRVLALMVPSLLASVPHGNAGDHGAIRQRVEGDTRQRRPFWKFW